ncbi:hypothetical protein T484DRAFT_1753824 [Baffinella frigidus]|nr:hypothetical protein T484DRAFT_1753824 [Cryptophyta sp. CCMP2293]
MTDMNTTLTARSIPPSTRVYFKRKKPRCFSRKPKVDRSNRVHPPKAVCAPVTTTEAVTAITEAVWEPATTEAVWEPATTEAVWEPATTQVPTHTSSNDGRADRLEKRLADQHQERYEKRLEKKRLKLLGTTLLRTINKACDTKLDTAPSKTLDVSDVSDVFSTTSINNRVNRVSNCWCEGVRVHSSCATKFEMEIPSGTRLCVFDGGQYGACTTDCISCVPCIVCHKVKDTDELPSLRRDFPVRDNWLFREERICPGCLACIAKDHSHHCDVCDFDFDSMVC